MTAPTVVLLDVNETLSDLGPMSERFTQLGASAQLSQSWFTGVLRDGFALATTGNVARFADIATDVAARLLGGERLDRDLDAAVEHVMAGFRELGVHADVEPGLAALHEAGVRLVTLSNGAASVAEELFDRAGLVPLVDRFLSVEAAGVWKPAPAAYLWACDRLEVAPDEAMLVAVHPWDTHGAVRAGLQAAWVDRTGRAFPGHFEPPTVTVRDLVELAETLQTQ